MSTKRLWRSAAGCGLAALLPLGACGGGVVDPLPDDGSPTSPTVAPTAAMPLTPGKTWAYDFEWSMTSVVPTLGVVTSEFDGRLLLHVERELSWHGRSAWRLVRYQLESAPYLYPFSAQVIYLSQTAAGLDAWIEFEEGVSEWWRILSTSELSFENNHFLLAGYPIGRTTELSASSVTVPAGTFETVRALVDFQHSPSEESDTQEIIEQRTEHYAHDVGLVQASWDLVIEDSHPDGIDGSETGLIALTDIVTGGFPEIVAEVEPNDEATEGTAQALAPSVIVAGRAHIDDAGTIVDDDDVNANILGEKLLQDWYRLETTEAGPFRLDLVFVSGANHEFNNLDVYLFREEEDGALTYVTASVNPEFEDETIFIRPSIPAGTYLVAVQARDTPTVGVDYWFVIW